MSFISSGVGEVDEVKDAASQERVGQLFFRVAGDDHDRALHGDDVPLRLVDGELHPVELVQEVVRELDVGLVDLVDQQDHALLGVEGLAHRTELDVFSDVVDVFVSKPGVVETLHRVVHIEAVLGTGGASDVPAKKRHPEGLGHRLGQQGLAGAGLAADQEGPFEHDRTVDRGLEGLARQVS